MKISPNQYHKNPRQITAKQYKKLQASLRKLGDLSGIVHNIRSNELVGGNQRSKALDISRCDVVLTEQYDAPDEQGTVAHGYVIHDGNKYAYRQVDWDAETEAEGNVVANKGGGDWDFDILANEFDVEDLLEWGFEPFEFGIGEPEIAEIDQQSEPDVSDFVTVEIACSREFFHSVAPTIESWSQIDDVSIDIS